MVRDIGDEHLRADDAEINHETHVVESRRPTTATVSVGTTFAVFGRKRGEHRFGQQRGAESSSPGSGGRTSG